MIVLFLTVSFAGGSLLIICEKKFGVFPHPPLYSSRPLKYMYKVCIFQSWQLLIFKGVGIPAPSPCTPVVMSLVYWDLGSLYPVFHVFFIKASGGGMRTLGSLAVSTINRKKMLEVPWFGGCQAS